MTGAIAALTANANPANGYNVLKFATEAEAVEALLSLSASDPIGHNPGCQAAVIFNTVVPLTRTMTHHCSLCCLQLTSPIQYDLRFASTPGGLHKKDNTNSQNQNWFTDQAFPFYEQPGN